MFVALDINFWSIIFAFIGTAISVVSLIFAIFIYNKSKIISKETNEILIEIRKDQGNSFEVVSSLFDRLGFTEPKTAKEWFLKGNSAYNNRNYEEAIKYYGESIKLNPKFAETHNALGLVYTEGKQNYYEAIKCFELSTQINPKNAEAFANWANALRKLAILNENKELLEESIKKYKKSAELIPYNDLVFFNWAGALYMLAKFNGDKKLFKESIKKYEKATKLNPNNDLAYTNWGIALSYLANMRQDVNLFEQAFEKYEQAFKINPKNTYNLSCGYALLGKKEKALHYLGESLENKRITVDWVLKDEDWKNHLTDNEFINLLTKYK